ncbi:MAG: hypothetical protein R2838_02445 [Caldilineaceae bacterium]
MRPTLTGFVGNDSAGVFIEVEGSPLPWPCSGKPSCDEVSPLAHIEAMTVALCPRRETLRLPSWLAPGSLAATLISPDLCTCDDCLRELFDPSDRRYRYPFINCTNRGPLLHHHPGHLMTAPLTTMAPFPLCPLRQQEYDDSCNRRFHAAQRGPVCGPQVWWEERRGAGARGEARTWSWAMLRIIRAQRALADGEIVAVKGIGAFIWRATPDDAVVARLRGTQGSRPTSRLPSWPPISLRWKRSRTWTTTPAACSPAAQCPIVLLPGIADSPLECPVALK